MVDRSIPFRNVILRCDRILPMEVAVPKGYAIRAYQSGDEQAWAALHVATGDFASLAEAEAYFLRRYASDPIRTLVAVAPDGAPVGVITAWTDDRQGQPVRSIHWLAVAQAHQRRGVGRALCQSCLQLLRREIPAGLMGVRLDLFDGHRGHIGFAAHRGDVSKERAQAFAQTFCFCLCQFGSPSLSWPA